MNYRRSVKADVRLSSLGDVFAAGREALADMRQGPSTGGIVAPAPTVVGQLQGDCGLGDLLWDSCFGTEPR